MQVRNWFEALLGRRPRPRTVRRAEPEWWRVLGFSGGPPASMQSVEARFRRLASAAHPDRGGSTDRMQRLIRARAEGRRSLSAPAT